MSAQPRPPGAFPLVGPLTYLVLSHEEVRAALAGPYPPETTWFHMTFDESLPVILRTGLIPGCWMGGDTCAVFRIDTLDEVPTWRGRDWIIEVQSRALVGPAKVWWVPPTAIRGAWRENVFYPLGTLVVPPATCPAILNSGCGCELATLVREQQESWRRTWR